MAGTDDILIRLDDTFAELAVCHCGEDRKHGHCDNHSFVWNPCPDTQMLQDAIIEITRLRAENAAMREALTPSGETKTAYIDEFEWDDTHDDGGCTVRRVVPWTTIKEIMAAIQARATRALTPPAAEENKDGA